MVAELARERLHDVQVLSGADNVGAAALTASFLKRFDAVIDFTTPQAVSANLRAALRHGAHVVVGTTGWYADLDEMCALAVEHDAGLLYGTNFSVGVQAFFTAARQLAHSLPKATFSITETHHTSKKDAPSGTAITLRQIIERTAPKAPKIEIESLRIGDAPGTHRLEARTENDLVTLQHDSFSRRGFAEGAVRAAEWVAGRSGVWDFAEIAGKLG